VGNQVPEDGRLRCYSPEKGKIVIVKQTRASDAEFCPFACAVFPHSDRIVLCTNYVRPAKNRERKKNGSSL
jgi:hypothetical protein